MANVWNAMKKREAEEAAKAADLAEPEGLTDQQAPPSAVTSEAEQLPGTAPGTDVSPAPGEPSEPLRKPAYSDLIRAHHDPGGTLAEQYRSLRIHLLSRDEDKDGKLCLLVTSSREGEGKTVTCANLAMVLAERSKTILVDADLRKARLATLLGASNTPGLAEVLDPHKKVQIQEAIQETYNPKGEKRDNLFFLPAGRAEASKVGGLLTRSALETVVYWLRKEYVYVVFDTPPINGVPDAGMIGQVAGEGLLVVRMNKTNRDSVDTAIRLLRAAQVKIGGIVLTHNKSRRSHYHPYPYPYRSS